MRLPDAHPGRWDLQQALDPDLMGPSKHYISVGEDTKGFRVTTAYRKLYFPLNELDEIISRLMKPATTTMQALSKQGVKCNDFKPSVRLRARKGRNPRDATLLVQCIKMELVPDDRAYVDDVEFTDAHGTYFQAQGYRLQATRGSPPDQEIKHQSHGLTCELYAVTQVIAELIANGKALLRRLDCTAV